MLIKGFLHYVTNLYSAVKSFVELVQYILKVPRAKFFLSERISQDPLENFFGVQRQRGRTGENPNVSQFCKNTQAIRVINSVCGNVSKGNCCGQEQNIDKEDIAPLPKHRRVRKPPSNSSTGENLFMRMIILFNTTFSDRIIIITQIFIFSPTISATSQFIVSTSKIISPVSKSIRQTSNPDIRPTSQNITPTSQPIDPSSQQIRSTRQIFTASTKI